MTYQTAEKLLADHDAPYWGFREPAIGADGYEAWFKPCFVYVLASGKDDAPVKIGLSADIERRIKQFEAGNPYGLREAYSHPVPVGMARQVESRVHTIFASAAMGREWFSVSVDVASGPIPLLCQRANEAALAHRTRIEADDEEHQRAMSTAEGRREFRNRIDRLHAQMSYNRIIKASRAREARGLA